MSDVKQESLAITLRTRYV